MEAGAQGEHKLARGYLPTKTYSAHYIADPSLRRAIADYLERERAYVDAASEELAEYAPFRKVARSGLTRGRVRDEDAEIPSDSCLTLTKFITQPAISSTQAAPKLSVCRSAWPGVRQESPSCRYRHLRHGPQAQHDCAMPTR